MNSIKELISFFPKYIEELSSKRLLWESSSHIMVLSIRPALWFKQPIILNSEYNLEASSIKEEKVNHDQEEIHSLRQLKRGKGKYKGGPNDSSFNDKYILVQNYYSSIQNLHEKVQLCNKETDSNLNINDCVEKITRIRKAKKIQELNFDQIIEENKQLIKENFMISDKRSKYMDSSPSYFKELIESEVNKRESKHEIIVRPPVKILKSSECQTDSVVIDDSVNSCIKEILIEQRDNISIKKGLKNKVSRIVSYIKNETLRGMRDLANLWKKTSDEINPEYEAGISGYILPALDPQTKMSIDQIVKPLILKSSKGSQLLFNSGKKMFEIFNSLDSKLMNIYFDLD